MKIFLSHSSKDKDVVGLVYNELGHAICHYDVATFDPTGFLPDEIYRALTESTHFVLFASKAALESKWVEGEIKTAFLNWMRAGVRDVMVFLLRDGTRDKVPDWLKAYVIIEHPSAVHIAARIKSKVAAVERDAGISPPFYRYDDLTKLEQRVVVSAEHMPKAIMLCSADGYGRKQLINELFQRHFNSVPKYKISLTLDECGSEVDLFRAVIGSSSLLTINELSTRLSDYKGLPAEERYELLAHEILKVCDGHQAFLVDAKDAILDEAGEVAAWLRGTIRAMARRDYPKLILLSSRRPTYISGDIVDQIVSIQLNPLPDDKSGLLFKWWLTRFGVEEVDYVVDQLHEEIRGNPKQIELAARLVANLDIPQGLDRERRKVFADLELQASELLETVRKDSASVLVLAFIAECGYISEADILSALEQINGLSRKDIDQAVARLISYGFVLSDEVSLRLPGYLVRSARKLQSDPAVAEKIKQAWNQFVSAFDHLTPDSESALSVLTDACLARLRVGENRLELVDNIILPSQCFRMARRYYDDRNYLRAIDLCKMAYQRRIALTNEGAIEVLRILGLSAARRNDRDEFANAINSFVEYGASKKAMRIKEFLLGFDSRLAGKFDNALQHMNLAYQRGGEGDFHILRELAFLHWAEGELKLAQKYIRQAKSTARLNPFVLDTEVKIELAFGDTYVQQNLTEIQRLLEELQAVEGRDTHSDFSFATRVELQLVLGNVDIALKMIEEAESRIRSAGKGLRILKVRALLANRRYLDAKDLALKLKQETVREDSNQRQSALPAIAKLIIESAAGTLLDDGIDEYGKNVALLPKKAADRVRGELLSSAAFKQLKLTERQKRILGLRT